ncbi:MAG TPA: VOC family protein [Gaiellaceae bacterium]|jgi:catechol 2,3-dioxygenase-like lactoylglutathione lyase family enzyme
MKPKTLDHVALWVADREQRVAAAVELGLRVIEQTDRFSLLGADARRGKLTFFDSEGPREPGALARIGLRVSSLDSRAPVVDLGEGLEVRLVEADTDSELDLDHVALYSADVDAARRGWEALGFAPLGDGRLEVGGAYLELLPGAPGSPERPLLNHLGVLVDSVEEHEAEAEELGVEIDDVVDAPNTLALFVWGPDRVKLEYIEHKPSFSLT